MRYITYFLVLFIFSLFTLQMIMDINSEFNVAYSLSTTMFYISISWIFALISIFTMIITRNITNAYGKFLLIGAKLALKFNLYLIQILLFVLWVFVLSFILHLNTGIHVYAYHNFFIEKIVISLIYGVAVDLILNGFTIIRRKK